MESEPTPEMPKVSLATQDWVLKEMMDTERRIEKAFHEQTIYLGNRFDTQNRWMIGIMVTLVAALIALVIAVYFE